MPLQPRTAFAERIEALPRTGGDILVGERPRGGAATIMARIGASSRLAQALAARELALPDGPACTNTERATIVGTGPGTWLMLEDGAAPGWAAELAATLADDASVADQSSSYAILRMEGTSAADLLARGAFLDFHADAFPTGRAAATVIAHVGVILWRPAATRFELAVFRSMAGSLWHWLETTAAAAGLSLAARID